MKQLRIAAARATAAGKRLRYILYHIRLDLERRDFEAFDRDTDIIIKHAGGVTHAGK